MENQKEVGSESYPQDSHRTIEPLPYVPQLCRVLGGVTIAIVLTYLEIHHSPPAPDPDALPARAGLKTPPIYLDCDQACADLGVSRRTLHSALESLSVWWRAEPQRSAAARAGREFISHGPSFTNLNRLPIKPYSIVGLRAYNQARTLAIHRNLPQINQILTLSRLISHPPQDSKCHPNDATSAIGRPLGTSAEILEGAISIGVSKCGNDWGWSDERRKAAGERMRAHWERYRAKQAIGDVREKS